jgi:phage baseplate assembly protein W
MSSTTQLTTPPSTPINIKYPMQYAPKGAFATNDTTVDAIADDLKILIKTNWGERVIQYDFGANLRALLFEPMVNTKQQISDQISAAVTKWMPFVTITAITVSLNEDDAKVDYNSALVKVSFAVGKTGLSGDVTVNVR